MLVTASKLVDDLSAFVRDTGDSRWTQVEKYAAINHALDEMSNRVSYPVVHAFDMSVGTAAYALPDWAAGLPGHLMMYSDSDYVSGESQSYENWDYVGHFRTRRDDAGQWLVETDRTADRDLLWVAWAPTGHCPVGTFTAASVAADDTEITLTTSETGYDLADVGWVQLDNEWMQYRGVDRTSYPSTIVLEDVQRGEDGTTAATHTSATAGWGVFYDLPKLRTVIRHHAVSYLMTLPIINAPSQEIQHFQWNLRWATQESMAFWRRYKPSRPARMTAPGPWR